MKENNLIINTHLLSIIEQLTDLLESKVILNTNWHEKEAVIAYKIAYAELQCQAKMLKEDIPKEYLKKCQS